ncbi:hypothetical protein THMIRHAT_22600 [Thiosulfativibrio zosterae]|uniref:Uncharacterized protein n=1 Tax=Thiosulfativibrio zosterae TaxID=2675053 RepID=A0A6F8PR52_9GAMM|nr:hypothetical protein THMIRHAT_22600 [Thiosulfativibrio zosterae]
MLMGRVALEPLAQRQPRLTRLFINQLNQRTQDWFKQELIAAKQLAVQQPETFMEQYKTLRK